MKILLSILLLILSGNVAYAEAWHFDKKQDEFTGKMKAYITSSNEDVRFHCNDGEFDNGSISLIVLYNNFIGESGGSVTQWVTNDKKAWRI
ncbi:hypothetical protein ACU5EH_25500 [Aliivibrio salmonicida]|uniref:hypothetical protein n=1 Tax=Aliivibrio salmonicida TaxID=40269 RepID=UPI00406CA8BD